MTIKKRKPQKLRKRTMPAKKISKRKKKRVNKNDD